MTYTRGLRLEDGRERQSGPGRQSDVSGNFVWAPRCSQNLYDCSVIRSCVPVLFKFGDWDKCCVFCNGIRLVVEMVVTQGMWVQDDRDDDDTSKED